MHTAPGLLPDAVPTRLRSSADLNWQGFAVSLLGIRAGTYRVPAMDHHRINVHVGAPVKANCRCDDRRYSRIQAHGDTDVVPAGLAGMWTDEADCRILQIGISDAFVRTVHAQLEARPVRAGIEPHLQLRDPRIQHLASALGAELEAQEASDPLYAESLCTALVVRLLNGEPALATGSRTLAPRLASRVVDYIESHLHQRLSLADLAAQAGMSVPHFKVLFRSTLGMPVHRYVVQRRVERARVMLLEGRMSATEIALEVGFAHQSHLTRWMNRLLGVTPREVLQSGRSAAAQPRHP